MVALPPLTLLGGDTLVISPSQLEQMKLCFQHWSYLQVHRRQANRDSMAAAAGKALHAALEVGYKLEGRMPPTQVEEKQREALHTHFKDLVLSDSEYRTELRFQEVLTDYKARWKDEQMVTLGVEVPFAIELGSISVPEEFWRSQNQGCVHDFDSRPVTIDGLCADVGLRCRKCRGHKWITSTSDQLDYTDMPLRVILRGIIDRIARFRGEEMVLVCDSKTMKDWDERGTTKVDGWGVNPQPKLYALALQQLQAANPHLGLPEGVKGFLLDAIIVRAPYAESTLKSAARMAKAKPRNDFKRIRYIYKQWELDEVRANALSWVQSAIEQHTRGAMQRNEHQCAVWFGGRCPYWDVCTMPEAQRAMILSSDLFRDKTEREWPASKEVAT
jgi:hypothetical protein